MAKVKVFSVTFQAKRPNSNVWGSPTTTEAKMGAWSAAEAKAQILKHYGSTYADAKILSHTLKREYESL